MRALALFLAIIVLTAPAAAAAVLNVEKREDQATEHCTGTTSSGSDVGGDESYNWERHWTESHTWCSREHEEVALEATYGSTKLASVEKGSRTQEQNYAYESTSRSSTAPCDEQHATCSTDRYDEKTNDTTYYRQEGVYVESIAGEAGIETRRCNGASSTRHVLQNTTYEDPSTRETYDADGNVRTTDEYCSDQVGLTGPSSFAQDLESCNRYSGEYHWNSTYSYNGERWDDTSDSYTRHVQCEAGRGATVAAPSSPLGTNEASMSVGRERGCLDCGEVYQTAYDRVFVQWNVYTTHGPQEGNRETITLP